MFGDQGKTTLRVGSHNLGSPRSPQRSSVPLVAVISRSTLFHTMRNDHFFLSLKFLITCTDSMSIGLGTTFGYLWWYGFHLPRVRARDSFYAKLEDQRARDAGVK
jgi:hypothetical protein